MKPSTQKESWEEQIYNILHAKSKVDIVRVLYEDEWPVEELVNLISQAIIADREKLVERLEKEKAKTEYAIEESALDLVISIIKE